MLLFILCIFYPLLCYLLSHTADSLLRRNHNFRNFNECNSQFHMLLFVSAGLLIHLTLLLVLCSLGVSLVAASFIAWTPVFCDLKSGVNNFRSSFKSILKALSFADIAFLTIILCLGISVFDASYTSISTPWKNNYGDIAFHLGMISSFSFGDNFPPEYHLYPGQSLSYPFYINLWSAELFALSASWRHLSVLFAYQWIFIGSLLLLLFKCNKMSWFAWILLFGGGSVVSLSNNSGSLIQDGGFWTFFLSTLWIPQRTFLPGITLGLIAVAALSMNRNVNENRSFTVLSGIILGLLPLVHLQCAFVFFPVAIFLILQRDNWKEAYPFLLGSLTLLITIPWVFTKSQVLSTYPFWMLHEVISSEESFSTNTLTVLKIWITQAWPLLLSLLWLSIFSKNRFLSASLWVIFLSGNILKLSFWSWDQVKIFVSLYALTLLLIAQYARHKFIFATLLSLSLIPSVYEVYTLFMEAKQYEVYSEQDLFEVENIKRNTPVNAIIDAASQHNSPVVLSGRKIFLGYEGTLWSHGIDYKERKALTGSLEALIECPESVENITDVKICPQYILDPKRYKRWRTFIHRGQLIHLEGNLYKIHSHSTRDVDRSGNANS